MVGGLVFSGLSQAAGLGVGPALHVGEVDPAEKWCAGFVLPRNEIDGGSGEVVVAGLIRFRVRGPVSIVCLPTLPQRGCSVRSSLSVAKQCSTRAVLLGLQYQLFRFDRYSMQSQLLVYPGLSDPGRIRSTTKTTFSVKLVNNFHTDFSFWDNFDSRPPNNSKRNDLGISNSIGWTF
jgi:hypothetical protein